MYSTSLNHYIIKSSTYLGRVVFALEYDPAKVDICLYSKTCQKSTCKLVQFRDAKYGPPYRMHIIVCSMQGYSAEYVDLFMYFGVFGLYFAPLVEFRTSWHGVSHVNTILLQSSNCFMWMTMNQREWCSMQRCEIRPNTCTHVSNAHYSVFNAWI